MKKKMGIPPKQGLYNPVYEHDACGIGFIANIKGEKSNKIVRQALDALDCLDHRGARGCEDNTGDGAGILMQVPHRFLQHTCEGLGINLPKPGRYGVGMVFFSDTGNRELRRRCQEKFEEIVKEEDQNWNIRNLL